MTLLLHTSTHIAHLGLAERGRIVARDAFPIDREFASTLVGNVRRLVDRTPHDASPALRRSSRWKAGLRGAEGSAGLRRIEKVIVHQGPGGFTGLRVGVATANALAYALGLPVVGVAGAVASLDELLKRAKGVPPAQQDIVVPTYSRPPNVGPVPGRTRHDQVPTVPRQERTSRAEPVNVF